jgi:beta-1,4-mannosyl-glycoprotein beta-1,4-N-acetylglucosaminyltransferase
MELRFNILNDYIDYFIVCESKYDHQGRKKKLTSIYINIQSLRKKLFILF